MGKAEFRVSDTNNNIMKDVIEFGLFGVHR